ncbi:MAG: GNAT family N-acetyltransferase [Bdellovibrionota bacterium]|nr:GNAT family N-acetyltransferase [Bdellovibrionota bacterium]
MNNEEIIKRLSSANDFSGHNFLDLKREQILNQNVSLLYSDLEEAVSFKSEDGTLHFYGKSEKAVSKLIEQRIQQKDFREDTSIFTQDCFLDLFLKRVSYYKKQFDFDYYRNSNLSKASTSVLDESLRFRFLTDQNQGDQDLLSNWYHDYNSEMETTWKTPILDESNREHYFCMIDRNSEPLAFVNFNLESTHRLWFGRFFIKPEHRGKSYGRAMIAKMKHMAILKKKDLALLVHTDNLKAIELYQTEGFEKQDRILVLSRE